MSVPGIALLQKKMEMLRKNTDYTLLLNTVAAICSSGRASEENLAAVADEVLRSIARDISHVSGGKIMLHIFVSGS
jgi:hypothetical protein